MRRQRLDPAVGEIESFAFGHGGNPFLTIELFYLPPYAPESNPDEYLNHDFKTSLRLEPASDNDSDLMQKAMRIMKRLAQMPGRVQSYFRHPLAAYAA
ncbi:transposase [Zoogloea ramigera]|uniref:transposase n=1 Tax=Zoogloea ramigera TaxID=350 RepID=UPI003FA30066